MSCVVFCFPRLFTCLLLFCRKRTVTLVLKLNKSYHHNMKIIVVTIISSLWHVSIAATVI